MNVTAPNVNTLCPCTNRRWLLRGRSLIVFALAIGVSILALPLAAHHGNAAYDSTRQIDLKGTVTQFLWANPHCVVAFDATDNAGQAAHWMAGTEKPTTRTTMDWPKGSLKPGNQWRIREMT